MAEIDRLAWCPLRKGKLGLWAGACVNEELRLPLWLLSLKWPDRFSRNVADRAKPESLLETGVTGIGGKFTETGETDDWGLVLFDLLVAGRSDVPGLECVKALKTGVTMASGGSGSPKEDEFCTTHFPRVLAGGFSLKSDPFSAEKAS